MNYEQIERDLRARGQEHLLRFYGELSASEQERLLAQIGAVDWETLALYQRAGNTERKGNVLPIDGLKLRDIEERKREFLEVGARAVRGGKVGAVLLAGGQGTRLGSDAPKGTFNIGVTRPLYIFEQLIRNLQETVAYCGAFVPLYVMTSDKNDGATRAFFKEHGYFGYPEEYVKFFVQDMAASVGFDGKVLLEEKGRLALSPNGNGGWYSSLEKAGLTEDVKARGVEWLNVFAVDNVLQRIADPAFLGATILSGKNSGAKVVCKASPSERVGVLCLEDGKPNVIEYYELSEEMANERDGNGDLRFTYGVILNYLFRVSKLEEIAKAKIPVHVVKKKIPFLDEAGNLVVPTEENGYKFETLILDMIKLTETCLPYEVEREREFAPVKNRTGTDSVETARALLEKNGVKL